MVFQTLTKIFTLTTAAALLVASSSSATPNVPGFNQTQQASAVVVQESQETLAICNAAKGGAYDAAKNAFPNMRQAIEMVEKQGVTPWYTDNASRGDLDGLLNNLSNNCGNNVRIPMVVYGIPGKDCEAGFSDKGFNKNMDDYKQFINKLVNTFQSKKPIYILEPDAVGLTANGGCGNQKNYREYLKFAIEALTSNNPDAEIYLDVGFWVVQSNPDSVARFVNEISNGKVKGITLNTSNYQRTETMTELCDRFAKAAGKEYKCIIDTSRNYRGPAASGAWCNVKNTGIGRPPTSATGNPRAAYYLWVKPPGESDGECNGQGSDSLIGPGAGQFFKEHFQMLWNNGYFVTEQGAGRID